MRSRGHVNIENGTNECTVRIWHGKDESCKTEAEALEAAELLKAFFEANQKGQSVDLMIDGATPASLAWQDGYGAAKAETDPLVIAEIAALIFAHNTHDFDERRAVESAAKIIELSRKYEK